LTFEHWLTVPPAQFLLAWFLYEPLWSEGITAKDLRAMFMQYYQILRAIPESLASDYGPEYIVEMQRHQRTSLSDPQP
jgi:hypothetical protein